MANGWKKKFKGNDFGGAWIYTHPSLVRAVVESGFGVRYNGKAYNSVADAKAEALKEITNG